MSDEHPWHTWHGRFGHVRAEADAKLAEAKKKKAEAAAAKKAEADAKLAEAKKKKAEAAAAKKGRKSRAK